MIDWTKFKNFTKEEFDCKHTGKNEMQEAFMQKLQAMRTEYGKSIKITSGYRDPSHPVEAKKAKAGYHSEGMACDIACNSVEAYPIIRLAIKHGFTGIGVNMKGNSRFIHLDTRPGAGIVYSY
jgi:uncharacterized protein YcbK (DUF882 family)